MALYNVFASYEPSNTWHAGHQAVDYPTPIGFIVRAPYSGRYYRLATQPSRTDPAAAGIWGELVLADGRRIRFCHLKNHIAKHGANVVKGQALARTGNTGFVRPSPTWFNPWAGAHMHTYGLDKFGKRWNWAQSKTVEKKCTGTVVPANGLRLRKTPVNGKTLAIIPKGVKLTAISFNKQWWKVKYQGKTGWIHAGYIR